MADAGKTPGRQIWSRDEALAAFNLYSRTPFGRLHSRNPDIVELAQHLGRTAGSVAMKCCNLAALDPSLQARGIQGLKSVSSLDRKIWQEFEQAPEEVGYASEVAYSRIMEREPRMVAEGDPVMLAGPTETQAQRRVRITQHLFRDMVLSGYACKCSVCTLPIRQLLVASHIVGWAADIANRMNPRNGICLCALHDRAFDAGILDVDEQYVIRITDYVRIDRNDPVVKTMLHRFDGERIKLPDRWLPDPELLTKRRQLLGIGA